MSPDNEKSKYSGYNGHASHTHKDQIAYVKVERQYEVLLDERMEYGEWEKGYYSLEVGTTVDNRTGGARVWWLVLKEQSLAADGETRTFERVGIGYKYTESGLGLFAGACRMTIKLV
jgi:hypothetical protein